MTRKKILVLTSTFPRWDNDSSPPFVFELSKRLTRDFEVTVLAPNYPGSLTREMVSGMRVRRFRYFWRSFETLAGDKAILPALRDNPLKYLLIPFFLLGEFLSVLWLIRSHKIEAIHAHWLLPQGLIAALVKMLTGTPFLVTAHGGDVFGLQGRFAVALKRLVLAKAAGVTVVSRALAAKVRELAPATPLEIIPMGVDGELFKPEHKDPNLRERLGISGPFLLFVGRLSEKKGVRYLLEAMPAVLRKFPEAKLVLIGQGELADSLRFLVRELVIAERVIFLGAVPNRELPGYYATADLFIGPSVTAGGGDMEGFGLTFVEAGLSGATLVGTDSGGIRDIIESGETGFMVREKDAADLAATLLRLIADPSTCAMVGAEARRRFLASFDWVVISGRYRDFLVRLWPEL